ncbi:hypothetical protein TOPH_00224 [Tolypocladium ophioglossoides CBS 100239]|uniref:Uncharacterized protein n=1 Tax=Tolypocladium ophioglossoides (strain CBS 100239) TaxID=1163406 RepID=A0A0L0NMB6_TOLOC|nr:hypothetical protein TOPH_00224 [Tolypocladium ophioglossoides CBS 100239]
MSRLQRHHCAQSSDEGSGELKFAAVELSFIVSLPGVNLTGQPLLAGATNRHRETRLSASHPPASWRRTCVPISGEGSLKPVLTATHLAQRRYRVPLWLPLEPLATTAVVDPANLKPQQVVQTPNSLGWKFITEPPPLTASAARLRQTKLAVGS